MQPKNKPAKKPEKSDYKILPFKTPAAFEKWLSKNHNKVNGLWIRLFKKDSGMKTITYAEALDEALCYGWIDGQVNKYDEVSYIQKFTPRRARSIWSKRNTGHIERLTAEGRMKPSGMAEVERAKADGRWAKAYEGSGNMQIPEDFLNKLSKNQKALKFYESLSKANKYAISWRLHTAKKSETRERRMKLILDMMKKGEKFH